MLRKRSRVTRSKEALMADFISPTSSVEKFGRLSPFLFNSPRAFAPFASKGLSETDPVMSPTSILDTKPFSALKNPFCSEASTPKSPEYNSDNKRQCFKFDSKGVGLAIVDSLAADEKSDANLSKPDSRTVLFGSQLKIQIPSNTPSLMESPRSPVEFGIKTKNSQLGLLSSSYARKYSFGSPRCSPENLNSPRIFTGCLSASEMELSEDYTCIIARGPVPKTTRIFDNCIVESCVGSVGSSAASWKDNGFSATQTFSYPSESFLSFCYTCKKSLGHGKDIFMYRGEKAFCSKECRYQEMMLEDKMDDE
ncbi:hypothetical protein Ancab_013325 [Ancistrocladus abbreviatus]